jgi:hypothetical protein
MPAARGPPAGDGDTETLGASTIADVLAAYRELEHDADEGERFWFEAARRMTVVALSAGLRGELLGLRWEDVEMLERRRSVVQQVVRNEATTRRAAPDVARSSSARSLPTRSRSSGRRRGIGRRARSCSRIRRSGRRSTRRS